MVHAWSTNRALGEATDDVKIGRKTGINIYQWCHDICSWKLINGPQILLGGPGSIVQIDESVFTHQGKVDYNDLKFTSSWQTDVQIQSIYLKTAKLNQHQILLNCR